MFGNTQGGGKDVGGPDACKTPSPAGPVPIPYPMNIAQGSAATGAAMTVLFDGAPAHNLGSSIPMSNGDDAGTLGGVVSNRFLGEARHTAGAFTVLVGGKPASRLTSPTTQNNVNAVGARVAPSQRKVLITG